MTRQIRRVLVANRGEIAVRVMRTCKERGLETVAVFSDADRAAAHVLMADRAIHIGPPPARESYLVIDKILAACREAEADAVHPGYGFLSENADFADACSAAGIVFLGPSGDSMRLMGSKTQARATMTAAGVPVVPGDNGIDGKCEGRPGLTADGLYTLGSHVPEAPDADIQFRLIISDHTFHLHLAPGHVQPAFFIDDIHCKQCAFLLGFSNGAKHTGQRK